ncbi:transporter substrate-binding domain-containing protein [Vibrio profundum]|uniref:substrate-binding periplasmic protein n=1 Tax=Vibrio profundum TaxID=2910247 RepID=UPI003D09EC25
MFRWWQVLTGCVLAMFSCSVLSARSPSLSSLNFLTEDYPPYNYREGSKLTGIAVDLLLRASQVAGEPIKESSVLVLPWSNAYRSALVQDGTVVFSTTRTPSREHLFHWVGPISSTKIVVLASKSNRIDIHRPEDFSRYRIGVIQDDVGHQLMMELGVSPSKLHPHDDAQFLARQLKTGRIDLWAYEENVARWWLDKSGYNTSDFEALYILQQGELYYAFNKNVDITLVHKLQRAIDKLKSDPSRQGITEYQAILNKYR